jgi:hypothetical protein
VLRRFWNSLGQDLSPAFLMIRSSWVRRLALVSRYAAERFARFLRLAAGSLQHFYVTSGYAFVGHGTIGGRKTCRTLCTSVAFFVFSFALLDLLDRVPGPLKRLIHRLCGVHPQRETDAVVET